MRNFLQLIGVFTLLYASVKIIGLAFAYFGVGHVYSNDDVIYYATEELVENWEAGDLDSLDCSKFPENKFDAKYTRLISLHSSMCTLTASAVPKLGEEWFTPVTSPLLPRGYRPIESERSNAKN